MLLGGQSQERGLIAEPIKANRELRTAFDLIELKAMRNGLSVVAMFLNTEA